MGYRVLDHVLGTNWGKGWGQTLQVGTSLDLPKSWSHRFPLYFSFFFLDLDFYFLAVRDILIYREIYYIYYNFE